MLWLFVRPTRVYLLDFFCSSIQFYLLLSPYLCCILALVCGVLLWVCYFPIGILGQVWYSIVSIPDLCTLTYFVWHNCSTEYNGRVNDSMDMSILYSDFLMTFKECMDEVVPEKQVRVEGRWKRPSWYNEDIQKARHEVNILSRAYKQCKTPPTWKKKVTRKTEWGGWNAENYKMYGIFKWRYLTWWGTGGLTDAESWYCTWPRIKIWELELIRFIKIKFSCSARKRTGICLDPCRNMWAKWSCSFHWRILFRQPWTCGVGVCMFIPN